MTCFDLAKRLALVLAVLGMAFLGLSGRGEVLLPSVSAQSSSAQLKVQGAEQSNYARLTFDLPVGVTYSVSQNGRQIRLTLNGRFNADFSSLESDPVRQIGNGRARISGQQTTIVFDTIANVSPRDFRSGQFLILDIYGGNANDQVVASTGSSFGLPPTQGLPPVSRGPATQVSGVPAQEDNANQPGAPASQGVPTSEAAQNPVVNPPSAANSGSSTPDVSPTQTVPGSADGDNTDGQTAARPDQTENSGGDGSTSSERASANTGNAASNPNGIAPDSDQPEPIEELPVGTGEEDEAPITQSSVSLNDKDVVDIEANMPRSESTLVLSGISDAVADPDKVLNVQVVEADNGIAMRFIWPIETALAAFERGGSLWVVFDQPYSFNPKGLVDGGVKFTDRVASVAQRPHQDAIILQFKLKSPQTAVVERDQNNWLVYLKDTPAQPRFPLKPTTSGQAGQGQQIFVAATDIGRKVEFEDPDVGDLLVTLPMLKQGNGIPTSYSYAAARILASAQGVVVVPETDFVSVERFQDGIAVRSTGNDALSSTNLSREEGDNYETENGFARLIDFKAWRIGPQWEYRKNKARLFYELSLRQVDDRNDVRWRIARYYLAHGRAAESLGMLEIMLIDDPLLERNTDFLAVRGVANFKQGRLEEAERDLSSRELESEQDAELWRALVAEARGDYEAALEFYRRGRDVMGSYDVHDRAEIELAMIRAAVETPDLELALRELALINGLDLNDDQLSEQVFQQARVAEKQGQYDDAFDQYDSLSDAPQRWLSARARYARVKFGVQNGDIPRAEAINELERLRYAWRGDRFEAQLLEDLAGLYFETGRYEDGLQALQLGVSYYPELAQEKRMLLRQQHVFKQLFLEDRADELSPIEAIGLFNKFTHLTPLGSEGDLLVRKLSQRMVSVDLLGRAAQILDYQVRARTEGAARAGIAATLAKIYIMDQKSEKALEILRATREPRLPQDIQAERRHVEARALVEQSRFEEAEVLLEDDTAMEAEVLRADIFWGAQDWPRVSSTIRRLLGDGWRRNDQLTALQRMNLVRLAIAMTFSEDRAGLIEIRRRYGTTMRGGDFANAFDLLTNDQELTGRELNSIASQIASVEKLQSFMRDYRNEFSGR